MAVLNSIPMRKASNVEIRLTFTRELSARIWIAVRLVKLAAWVLGNDNSVIVDGGAEPADAARS